jgi:hypothetical protein
MCDSMWRSGFIATNPANCRKPGVHAAQVPWITHRHALDHLRLEPRERRSRARSFTAVGLRRASIGPPIIVSVRGTRCFAAAMSETPASTGHRGLADGDRMDFARTRRRSSTNSRTYAT